MMRLTESSQKTSPSQILMLQQLCQFFKLHQPLCPNGWGGGYGLLDSLGFCCLLGPSSVDFIGNTEYAYIFKKLSGSVETYF
jgi:hypothetical protein